MVNGILAQVASNLKTSTEVTYAAFNKRTNEVKHAKGKLEEQKSETIVKIQEIENTLQSLEQAIMAKQGPLATCQVMRLFYSFYFLDRRSNVYIFRQKFTREGSGQVLNIVMMK